MDEPVNNSGLTDAERATISRAVMAAAALQLATAEWEKAQAELFSLVARYKPADAEQPPAAMPISPNATFVLRDAEGRISANQSGRKVYETQSATWTAPFTLFTVQGNEIVRQQELSADDVWLWKQGL